MLVWQAYQASKCLCSQVEPKPTSTIPVRVKPHDMSRFFLMHLPQRGAFGDMPIPPSVLYSTHPAVSPAVYNAIRTTE
jgi:hypothetical protein